MNIVNEPTIKEVLADNEYELPIGYTDRDGVLHKTVFLKEMTGYVDEALADQKVRTNPAKMVSEVIFGVVEKLGTMNNITRDAVTNLYGADRDFIIAMNHVYSLGEEVTWTETCESCREKFEATVDITQLPVKYLTKESPKEITLELPRGIEDAEGNRHKKIRISIPTGFVQERVVNVARQNPYQAITQMLSLIVEEVEGLSHWNLETFQKMSKKDRTFIQKELSKLDAGISLDPTVACASCGHTYSTTIPVMTLLGE